MDNSPYASVFMTALDFMRKIHEHSKIRQFLFKIICGKYAYREYEIMSLMFEFSGHSLDFGYGLENCEYHKKSISEIKKGWVHEKTYE